MNNNMICDNEKGICGIDTGNEMELFDFNLPKEKVDLYYVTDPICSYCWAVEPALGKFKELYKDYLNFHVIMGGLLEDWEGFADLANGINGPSDVSGHWREVGEAYRMPIDGSFWLTNPVKSSFIPSRVYKVIQKDNKDLALSFLRKAREAVMAFNKNIAEDDVLIEIVNSLGLKGEEIVKESYSADTQELLIEDFKIAGSLGARSFPSIIMVNKDNKGVKVSGARPFDYYVAALKQVITENNDISPAPAPELSKLLKERKLLFSKEIEELYDIAQSEVKNFIDENLSPGEYEMEEILGETYIKII